MDASAATTGLLSFTVLANMGTPLMWAPIGQLLVGNLLIGIGEGWLLSRVFRIRAGGAMLRMIVANYLSFSLGWFFLPSLSETVRGLFPSATFLYAVPWYLLLMAALTFIFTVVLEWPVCFSLLVDRERAFRKSWAASLLAQSASYGFLVAYYLNASSFSLYTQVEVTPELLTALPDTAAVYFESAKDGERWRVRLNGQGLERVSRLDTAPRSDRDPERPWKVIDRRRSEASEWTVHVDFWPSRGIEARHVATGRSFQAAIEVPFLALQPTHATLLPGELLVYQLGPDQIVVLDLNARKLALLAAGRSPVVALDPPPAVADSAKP